MPKNVVAYDLLISCASDVSTYISKIEVAVNYFNNHYGRLNDVIIRTIHWSKNAYPEIGAPPQALLNKQIVDDADMVIGMFWTRFGTPTQYYDSGTEEEIELMISRNKPVLLYFLNIPILPTEIDYSQYSKVVDFKKKHKNDGVYWEINNENELPRKICEHLELHIQSVMHGPAFKADNGKREILWVDDRPENNVYERKTLENYGLEFSLALSTQQALQNMHSHKYALIISDMGRKEGPKEGYVLLEEIRKINKTIPFIIYAGSRKPEHIEESLSRGAQGCTNDPTELIDLVIRNLLKI